MNPDTPSKARSRLRPDFKPATSEVVSVTPHSADTISSDHLSHHQPRHLSPAKHPKARWWWLSAALIGWLGLAGIMTSVQPSALANWLIPGTYLPLLGWWWATWWCSWYGVWPQRRAATWLATALTLGLALQLQGVVVTPVVVGGLLVLVVITELSWRLTHLNSRKQGIITL